MRPVRRFSVPHRFSVRRADGRRQLSRYLRRQPYQSRFRRRRTPSAAPRPADASSSRGDNGQSSVTSEDRNAMQNPQEVFPHEDRDGSSDFPTLSSESSQDSSTVKIEINLEDSEDECELVIDMSPQAVDEDPRMNREYTNVMRDGAICEEESGGSVTECDLGDGEEESEGNMILLKNDNVLNEYEEPGNAFPKANEIYLHDVKTDTLKALEEGDAHASAVGKCASSAAFIEADTQKEILTQENEENSRLVKAIAQKHTNEDHVKSGKQSVWCTGHFSRDETTSKRPCKKTINAEEGQSKKENGGNDSPKESYTCPTYLNIEGSKTILQSSSVKELASSKEDSELSDSDNSIEECQRIFDEFERELQKKNSELQAYGQNADVNVLETKSSIPGQKTRITHTEESQDHDAAIQQGHKRATEFAFGVKEGEGFVTTTNEQKKATSTFSDAQFQSTGPVVPLNVVQTSKCQLYFQWTENTATGIGDVINISDVPNKIIIQKRLFVSGSGFKVPLETRQRYISLFLTECFKICPTVDEAVNKALMEEQSIYDRCGNKKMYLNFAVKAMKKLRDHAFTGCALYELLKSYLLTEEQLNEYNFPRPNPEKKGDALFSRHTKRACHDAFRRVCCRCGTIYSVLSSEEHECQEECNYHSGIVLERKVAGGIEKRYSCCEELVGSPGCQYAKCHVHDGRQEKLEAFMKTFVKPPPFDGYYGVYALDCEMCYTTRGLELTRVTVVDTKLQVVYDTLVKPGGEVVDCDTRLSGVTEDNLKNTTTSILEVQAVLLHLFNANTILIGHGLENDLFVLKLIHDMIVDTSVVFPHPLGFPHKRALRSLMADNLRKIHGDGVEGYNSKEDAIACMELILWKIKANTKKKN